MARIELFGYNIELKYVSEESSYGSNIYRIIDHRFGQEIRVGHLKTDNAYILEDFPDDGQPTYSIGYFDCDNNFISLLDWDSIEWESEIQE